MLTLILVPSNARAGDLAVLFGLGTVNGPRPAVSWAIGHAPAAVGFEIEYLGMWGGTSTDRSSAGGIFGSVIVQREMVANLQPFAIVGFGMWGESFDDGGTGVVGAKDIGGGIKVRMTRRLRLRLDYRLFLIGDSTDGSRLPSTTRPQRISAGLHVAF